MVKFCGGCVVGYAISIGRDRGESDSSFFGFSLIFDKFRTTLVLISARASSGNQIALTSFRETSPLHKSRNLFSNVS